MKTPPEFDSDWLRPARGRERTAGTCLALQVVVSSANSHRLTFSLALMNAAMLAVGALLLIFDLLERTTLTALSPFA